MPYLLVLVAVTVTMVMNCCFRITSTAANQVTDSMTKTGIETEGTVTTETIRDTHETGAETGAETETIAETGAQ